MQTYEAYKETGIEWIGKIPKHWKIERLGDVSKVNIASLPANTSENFKLRYIDISNVNYNGIASFENIEELTFEEAPSRARRIIKKNDIIISTVRPNLQAVAYINFDDENLICSTGFNVVSPKNQSFDSKFLYYFLISEVAKQYFSACATGVGYPSISDYPFRSIKISIPPIAEQKAIAQYLDQATEQIDKAIEIKTKQLEKLETYKKSKIYEAVTKGIEPNPKLKPSNISWIGEIPEDWKVERLGDISNVNTKSLPANNDVNYKLRYIDISNVDYNGIISFENIEELTFEEAPSRARRIIKKNNIIISTVRPNLQAIAYINLDDENLICSTGFNVVSPKNQSFDSKFLYYFLLSEVAKQYFSACATGVGYPSISDYPFRSIKITIPPISEQKAIATYLDNFCKNIENAKENIEKQLTQLKKYRKSLIHECVTGKRKIA
jgi:type I restriction enzyme S subunit